jgi:glutamyl endopeptidase
VVAEDPVPLVAVHSSTRGAIALDLAEAASTGGRPFNPGAQAEATRRLAQPARSAPAGPPGEASAESVLGADGRTWLRGRTGVYPNSAIGRIDYRHGGNTYWCTGTLIDADTVLTAGHCVHDGSGTEGGWSTRVRFLPGVEGNTAPFGACGAREMLTLPGWYAHGGEYQDLGLIQLDCAIGNTVGWFGYRAIPGRNGLLRVPVHVRGYPGDKVWSSLWTMRERVAVSQPTMAFYAADTYGGQSGSPVFNWKPCNGAVGPCILAVHGYAAHGPRTHGRLNHGPRLDEARVALIGALAAGA